MRLLSRNKPLDPVIDKEIKIYQYAIEEILNFMQKRGISWYKDPNAYSDDWHWESTRAEHILYAIDRFLGFDLLYFEPLFNTSFQNF